MNDPDPQGRHAVVSFGPFRLSPAERLLTRRGHPTDLGGRALDLLIALVEAAPRLVTNAALMARVWPDATVDPGSLRYHVSRLRKVLGDGQDGARYLETDFGRGYSFVGELSHETPPIPIAAGGADGACALVGVPASPSLLLGRDAEIDLVGERLVARRFVTLVGAGGVGKTTLAAAAARQWAARRGWQAIFVDLTAASDPVAALAASLAVDGDGGDRLPSIVAALRSRRALLVLDGCEVVVDDAARLAERLLRDAPEIHLLATGREPLRADGERVHRVDGLAGPTDPSRVQADELMEYPSTRLFLDRLQATGASAPRDAAAAQLVADLCGRLDGAPLAIELAAGQAGTDGLRQTATLIADPVALDWTGRRTATPRHRTARANLAWSWGRLSPEERVVLNRLSAFAGEFSLSAALSAAVGPDDVGLDGPDILDALAARSLLATARDGGTLRYRLPLLTRVYAQGDLAADEADPRAAHARRHEDAVATGLSCA